MFNRIAVIGSSGAIGRAIVEELVTSHSNTSIHTFSRQYPENNYKQVAFHKIDYHDEKSIANAALDASEDKPIDLVIVATGILHDNGMMPEKSLQELSAEKFEHLFSVNTIVPAIIAKHFIPRLNKEKNSVFAVLSARLGSISDNQLGGWYAYRASKAALNMIIKNAAIETSRKNKKATIIGVHPGTVNSKLSKPFQSNIPKNKLFTANYSAQKILDVLYHLKPQDSGKCFAWDGKEVIP